MFCEEEVATQDSLDFGAWEIKYYVDEFGDPTGNPYITNKEIISGKFTNSATANSDLIVNFIIDDKMHKWKVKRLYIQLLEYGTQLVNGIGQNFYINIKQNGKVVSKNDIAGYIPNDSDRLVVEVKKNYAKFIKILKDGGELKFSLSQISTSPKTSYNFVIDNADGFTEALDKLQGLKK
tara:strand:- start:348 stop:884 length:537 start_codon:yes stop_codon:yes gene_type:complete